MKKYNTELINSYLEVKNAPIGKKFKIKNVNFHLSQILSRDGEGEEDENSPVWGNIEFNNYFGEIEVIKQEGDEEGEFFFSVKLDKQKTIDFLFKNKNGGHYMECLNRIEDLRKKGYSNIISIKEMMNNLYNNFEFFIYLEGDEEFVI